MFTPILTIRTEGTRVGIQTHELDDGFEIPFDAQFGMIVGVFDWVVSNHPESRQIEIEKKLLDFFGKMVDDRHEFISREKVEE